MNNNKILSIRIRFAVMAVVLVFLSISLTSCKTNVSQVGLRGGSPAQTSQNLEVQEVSIDQAYQLYQEKVAFLDVRTPQEWNDAHVPGSTLLPLEELANRVDELPQDLELVVYCRSGNRSGEAARILLEAGFTDVYSMQGGLKDWIAADYEVDTGE